MKKLIITLVALAMLQAVLAFPQPKIPFDPEKYICYRTHEMMKIDGKLKEEAWTRAEWSRLFVDIEGNRQEEPRFKTRVKMLWDQSHFYIAAVLEEPHIWADLTERDAERFTDNAFNIYIDPQGDTHGYYELRINAMNTIWDMLHTKPSRDAGSKTIDSWNIQDLKSGVNLHGTLNDPNDTDSSWEIEAAIPWQALVDYADRIPPQDGDQWRVNFLRIEWQVDYGNGEYFKLKQPESNWVWSPQGLIDMHYPEMWGFVQFSRELVGTEQAEFVWNRLEGAKWVMRQLYYRQREFAEKNGTWTEDITDLRMEDVEIPEFNWPPELHKTTSFYEAVIYSIDRNTRVHIRSDGKIWID
jgi:hypothetical protein